MKVRLKLIFFISLFCFQNICAQSVKELEQRRKQTLQNLSVTTELLRQTSRSKQSSVNKINILQQNISQRKNLIQSIHQEIGSLDRTIDTLQNEKEALKRKLESVQHDYARLVRETHYRFNSMSILTFVLSATDFNQMFRRLRYLHEFGQYRKKQAAEIKEIQEKLDEKENFIKENRYAKSEILLLRQQENRKLEKDREKENQMLNDLKKKEKILRQQQLKQQKTANEINKKIQDIINSEIKKEKKTSGSTGKIKLTKEESLIAGNFANNKGRLPWPVEKGFVSGKFGIQQHPVLEHVTTNNKGIYIQTEAGADARAIFEGVVTQCFSIPGNNKAVIVKHGNYRSVYTNLTLLYVKEGMKVTAKQKIGKIFVDEDNERKTEMMLMIYLDTTLQNPEYWITKQ